MAADPEGFEPTTRWCVICDTPLDGSDAPRRYRRHARTCGPEHTIERSRLLRILGGQGADGFRSLAHRAARRRKPTGGSRGGAPDA